MTHFEGLLQHAIAKICHVDAERVRADAKLSDLGVDSLAAAEVLVEMEIVLGRQLPVHILRRLDQAETVSDVAAQLELALNAETSAG
jgi:acyl carrier protein